MPKHNIRFDAIVFYLEGVQRLALLEFLKLSGIRTFVPFLKSEWLFVVDSLTCMLVYVEG